MFKSRRKEESSNAIAKMNQEQEENASFQKGRVNQIFIYFCFDRRVKSQASVRVKREEPNPVDKRQNRAERGKVH